MILRRGGSSLPVNQGIPHVGGDGAWLSLVEPEDALDDGELSTGGVQPAEGTPVIDHHPRCDHLTAAVHRPSLLGHGSHEQKLAQLLTQPWHKSLLGGSAHTAEEGNSATSKVLKVPDKMINEQPLLSGEKLVWHSVKENSTSRKDNSIHTSN